MSRPRLLRVTTVPVSLHLLLRDQFAYMKEQGFEVLTVSADGQEKNEILKQGISHQVVNMTRSITPVRDLIALIHLIMVIRKFKPQIVHTHTPKAGLLGMLASWICRVPVRMHTVAGLPLMEAKGLTKKILKITESITYSCAHWVYPNSLGLLDYMKQSFSGFQSKMKIIGKGSSNGIDISHFRRTHELERQAAEIRSQFSINKEITFSFVGRLVKDKGIVELVEAFKRIEKEIPSKLLLVGSFEEDLDPLPQGIMDFVRNDSNVILAGFQQDIRPWMIASDIFVFPSYREGFPNVVMQAACLGLSCIVSDINGCNELIQNNETGKIVPAKNVDLLYESMKALVENGPERELYGQRCQEYVMKNFDRKYIWNEILKEYNRLLTEN